ncbi:RING finger and CHY zinc finger domain-containing protein [Endozoicomonas sp. 8E]|uniref:RING finger and CHY zinc finger domain-containing protein n=1 Tax=Endozoicomonas sp. 8E TaxID=3035692 RepID=UPI0029393915|nr:CHY zinc finger protein [Endozoicomonas sp. 8E]WOG27564.1 CHY zinc finger protein [Endozoicomonas sp. 8E]
MQLCHSATIIERHYPDGRRARIEINHGTDPQGVSQWQISLLLPEGFDDQNSTLCFKAPVVSADWNSIALLVKNDLGNYCYQLVIVAKEQTYVFQDVSKSASENSTLVRLKSTTADKPELASVTTNKLLNGKSHATPLTFLVHSDNMTNSGLEAGQNRNSTLAMTGERLAGNADFSGGGNGGFFYSPPPPWGGGGRASGLFEIDLIILRPVINWLMSMGKDSSSPEEQPSPTRLKITRVNGDGSSSEAVIPLGWLDFLSTDQLTDVNFWNTLFQRAAISCPASESLHWQLGCLKQFFEHTVLKTDHAGALKAGNEGGEPSGKLPDEASKEESNDHQKEKKGEPEDQGSGSPGEGNYGNGDGNNRKDDNGKESEKNTRTQDLQVLAKQLVALIESDDPDAVFKLRQILDELDMPQRLQVLETKGTNTEGNTATPLEAILQLQRSFYENSMRNRFLEQLVEATSDQTKTLDDFNIPSELQPIIPPHRTLPEAGNNNLVILYKIVLDIIHRVNQSEQQPPLRQFEKCCFAEYLVQLLLLYSNPIESIRDLLEKIPDSILICDIMFFAKSLTFSISFRNAFLRLKQHPSRDELERLSNGLMWRALTHSQRVLSIKPVINHSANGYLKQGARPKPPALADQQNPSSQKRLQTRRAHDNHQTNEAHERSDLQVSRRNQNVLTPYPITDSLLVELKRDAEEKREKKRQRIRQIERQRKAGASPAMQSNGKECSASYQQSSNHNEETNPPDGQLKTSVQENRKPLCGHYHRLCRVNFGCCAGYFPCQSCHNMSDDCEVKDRRADKAIKLKCSICNYEGDITEDSQTCPGCNQLMSDYFCAQCKHFTNLEKKPFHCDKCGICRKYKDKCFHCDVCNVCLDIRYQDNHKCRKNSGHDECCICLEDAFSGCVILSCSHKVHRECGTAMIKSGITTCPVCRRSLYNP